jgi:serine O-acetyltransferase
MRSCRFIKEQGLIVRILFYIITKVMLRRATYKFGISIPPETDIGAGFYIGHFNGIFVNPGCRIGANCNISQGVTLGQSNRGKHEGFPVLGDNVYLGPGAKVVGGIQIGNNVAIGANCVVTQDIPDNAVVVGIPGKVISMNGSQGYINRTDYDQHL